MFRILSLSVALSFVSFASATAGEAAASKAKDAASCPLHAKAQKNGGAAVQSVLGDVDKLLADKCDCKGAGDCTCKKGQCKCKSCGTKKLRMFESVKGSAKIKLPDARHDATAGVFI